MPIQHVETIILEIRDLEDSIKRLSRDVSLSPSRPIERRTREDLHALLRWGHELRGRINALDETEKNTIAQLSARRGGFTTRDREHAHALAHARSVHKDDHVVLRELAVSLSATQLLLTEKNPASLWSGVMHVLNELKTLRTQLLTLKAHLMED
jgi:hypothetical protein